MQSRKRNILKQFLSPPNATNNPVIIFIYVNFHCMTCEDTLYARKARGEDRKGKREKERERLKGIRRRR